MHISGYAFWYAVCPVVSIYHTHTHSFLKCSMVSTNMTKQQGNHLQALSDEEFERVCDTRIICQTCFTEVYVPIELELFNLAEEWISRHQTPTGHWSWTGFQPIELVLLSRFSTHDRCDDTLYTSTCLLVVCAFFMHLHFALRLLQTWSKFWSNFAQTAHCTWQIREKVR